jgi:hypothetical protein
MKTFLRRSIIALPILALHLAPAACTGYANAGASDSEQAADSASVANVVFTGFEDPSTALKDGRLRDYAKKLLEWDDGEDGWGAAFGVAGRGAASWSAVMEKYARTPAAGWTVESASFSEFPNTAAGLESALARYAPGKGDEAELRKAISSFGLVGDSDVKFVAGEHADRCDTCDKALHYHVFTIVDALHDQVVTTEFSK